ncbi:uridine kinase [Anaeramoeba flamelloides]|uniref:Uridine kinase n=1 Tax=Anaeramoeba flamelloides TaxID=1746091 RepID=A0AAV7ZV49_9EUKA|nr:uridine kinase [Anaeramoeba flamelloides]
MTSLPNQNYLPSQLEMMFNKETKPFVKPETLLIGVCGGSASGKTSVCREIIKQLKGKKVDIIAQDWFYKPLTEEQRKDCGNYNFDSPLAIDLGLLTEKLRELKQGKVIQCPDYDFVTHSRTKKTHQVSGDVILIEGIFTFETKELRDLYDMKIFVDVDSDIRLSRRILRDTSERGRTLKGVIEQYLRFVKPGFESFVVPKRKFADVIILRGASNKVAIDLLLERIKVELRNHEIGKKQLKFNSKSTYTLENLTIPTFKKVSIKN